MEYDYIIAGAGCAGLSLLYAILNNDSLNQKNILVIDRAPKKQNDRTWCFWEKESGPFQSIVYHQWNTLKFHGEDFEREFQLKELQYKMIRGIDFYNHILKFANNFKNVIFKYEAISSIKNTNDTALIETEKSIYQGRYVFNSTSLFHPEINTENSLLQHFEGWVIKTEEAIFDSSVGTLMDFRLDQKNGATFMYVLPTSGNEALIEFTLFSPKLLEKNEYKEALEEYITDFMNIETYEIIHKEFGVIPMSLATFNRNSGVNKRVFNIGTAGGFTKASSGYTFQFIQEHTQKIIEKLTQEVTPNISLSIKDKRFQWYDRTLLDVLLNQKLTGKEIFSIMFKKLSPEKILTFLGNKTSFMDELKIMSTLPIVPFLTSGINQLKK